MVIPDFLTHYFHEAPFQTLSELDDDAVAETIAGISGVRELPFRLTHPEYLPRRRVIEQQMRSAFAQKGGSPRLVHPHYLILGRSPHWEAIGCKSLSIPLAHFDPDVISLTYTDSVYTFSPITLRGIEIPDRPHRRTVYRVEELESIVARFGLPPGYTNPDELFDTYIEAQVWDEDCLIPFRNA